MSRLFESWPKEDREALKRLLNQAEDNLSALEKISHYLTICPRYIQKEDLRALTEACDIPEEEAYALLMAAACGLAADEHPGDRRLMEKYFRPGVHRLKPEDWLRDPYLQKVRMPKVSRGAWRLGYKTFAPYEAFASDDPHRMADGLEIPQVGYFREAFQTPLAEENGREWMTVTPSEQNTMTPHIDRAFGKTVVFGLGLGYYAMRVSEKPEVSRVTVVEKESAVISLVQEYLLPQFPHREKIELVQADAFDYARNMGEKQFNCAYVDLWHDVGDGVPMYLRFKQLEKYSPKTLFMYWIEPSMLMWLRGMALEEIREGKPGPMLQTLGEATSFRDLRERLSLENIARLAERIPPEVCVP